MNKHMLRMSVAFVVVVGTLAASAAWAGQARTHDGFFLRLSPGAGSASAELKESLGKVKLSGTASDVDIAIGGIVAPNLALHGTLWGWSLSDPTADITVSGFGSASGTVHGTLMMSAVGVGATYYFMPMNMYMSGSVGLASLSGDKDMNGKSKEGMGVEVVLGKEWWVGQSWGLGLSGAFNYFNAKDDDILGSTESWKGPGFGVRFSATMN